MKINLEKIKIIILDVDGTMTDGKISYDNNGIETKSFDVKDGMAIAQAIKYGIKVAIITGRISKIVEHRALELGILDIYQGVGNKIATLDELLRKYDYNYENVAYMGDDINDIPAMMRASYVGITADAVSDIEKFAHFKSKNNGGYGAVREFIETILKVNGIWSKIIEEYKSKK
ncbi:MAG: 3-deoxy-D-manno-octulosonate 8-phosphate phosphatase [Fusobacteriia bacterium 4572_74]|nr:MAG: 3-deoxy-D-manno-octulosonate 8-phosphate phosphatase [Fusobacteriia bacterium 4572_74]